MQLLAIVIKKNTSGLRQKLWHT